MSEFVCPYCGQRCEVIAIGKKKKGRRPWRTKSTNFEANRRWEPPLTQPAVPALTIRQSPILERHVTLPFRQSLICGFYPGALAFILTLLFTNAWWMPPVMFGTFFLLGSGIAWFVLFSKDRRLLWLAESITGLDINKDGSVGKPEPKTTIVDFTDHDERHRYRVELPVNDSVMKEIAHAMLGSAGRYNFSRRDMMAKTSISDDAFEKIQKEFLRRGWAAYRKENKPNSGVALLAAGRAVLREFL